MKKLALTALLAVAAFSSAVHADVYVRGYTRSDGTYVAPHYRSDANATRNDNWSTRGNVNPYTGKPGTKSPDAYGPSYGNHRNHNNSSYHSPYENGRSSRSSNPYQW